MMDNKKESVIEARYSWFNSKRFLQLIHIIIILHFGINLKVEKLTSEKVLIYISLLFICNSIVCYFLKKVTFHLSHIEYYYPFRYWDKKRYKIKWNEILFFRFRGGFRESRFQLKSNTVSLIFECTNSELEQLKIKLKEELRLKKVQDYWEKNITN